MSKGGGNNQTYGLPQQSIQASFSANNIPAWLTNASQRGVGAASKLLNSSTPSYSGELAPGLTADQTAAGGMFRNAVGAYNPAFGQAQDYTNAATAQGPQIDPQTYKNGLAGISDYMNPYIGNVINAAQAQGDWALRQNLNTLRDQAINHGAAYGSRHGVQEGAAAENAAYDTQQFIANALNQGYGQATNMLGQDISNNMNAQAQNQGAFQNYMNRLLGAGSQTGNLATAQRAANVSDINNVFQYGSAAQQTQGAQDQAAYNEFLRQQQYPLQALQAYNQTLASAPHDTTSFTQSNGTQWNPQQQQSSNALMGGLGGAMAGAQMGSMFGPWGTAIGAGAGGLLGAFH